MKRILPLMGFVFFLSVTLSAQVKTDRCGTITLLKAAIAKDPTLATRMAQNEALLQQSIANRKVAVTGTSSDTLLIPVVFHIVLSDPTVVSDAAIQAQMDTLNKDYAGLNADSTKIPSWFLPLFGHSTIRFTLAKRTPDNKPTTGIIRKVSTGASFTTDDKVKASSTGGDDPWNTSNYLNIWLCPLSGGLLGYSQIPGMSIIPGVVVEYRSVPGVSVTYPYTIYNEGKTLTHEVGHFFNLYHIWGDDDGACTGTDYVDDTPNQGNSTSGTPSTAVVTDKCTVSAPGIMYQNYMDYTDDDAMEMFTLDQVTRMESAAATFRASLLTSPGSRPLATLDYDADMSAIEEPGTRLCAASFKPVVSIANYGLKTLTSLTITAQVDGGTPVVLQWSGSVATLDSFQVELGALTASLTAGTHVLKVYTSQPNGQTDENMTNDTLKLSMNYTDPVSAPLVEGFEGAEFAPAGWDIVNPDGDATWVQTSAAASTGSYAAMIKNYTNVNTGTKDDLRLPQLTISNADSAWMTFKVAYGVAFSNSVQVTYDTLEVLASTDCGATYTSLYKKWGSYLSTSTAAFTGAFTPTSAEWRKDSVDLTKYIGQGAFMLLFRNTNEHVNNLYLDDINVYADSVSANLKDKGILITPNPSTGPVSVDFYPAPVDLKAILVYDMTGKQVAKVAASGSANTHYAIDLSSVAPGIYVVKVVTGSRTVVKEIVKIK